MITDGNDIKWVGTETTMDVGSTLHFKSKLFNLAGDFVAESPALWTIKSISGFINSGLTCGAVASQTCDFTPTAPGIVYIEAALIERDATVVGYSDATARIVVSAPSTATTLERTSGHQQSAVVHAQLLQPLKVTLKDSFMRGVAGSEINFVITSGSAQWVSTNPHITDSNGIAQAQLQMGDSTGSVEVTATLASNNALTQTFTISVLPSEVDRLEFLNPPMATYANLPLDQGPIIVAKDLYGNIVTTLSSAVTASVQNGNGTLSGNTTKNFINGQVSFTDLVYNLAETGVKLRFTSAVGNGIYLDTSPLSFSSSLGQGGITPNDVDLSYVVTSSTGILGKNFPSAIVTMNGLTQPIGVSVSGSGHPQLRLDGGTWQEALLNVTNGQTIQVRAEAPTVHGGVNVITVTMGGRVETFEVRYVDPSSVAYAYIRSGGYSGSYVSDSSCTSVALTNGYGGNWKTMTATNSIPLKNKIPYLWGQLKRLDGLTIANSWNQLWTETLYNPINIDQFGAVVSANVYTGVSDTNLTSSDGFNCLDWTTSAGAEEAWMGLSASTDNKWLKNTKIHCSASYTYYCISDPTGPLDTNPKPLTFTEVVTGTLGERVGSNSVLISGLTTYVPISVSSTSGTAMLKINGGAEVTTGTVGNGDHVEIKMNAPLVYGQKNTATVTIGTLSPTWWVGAADYNKTAGIFVTSTTYAGNFGGLATANGYCQSLATAAGYGGTWSAFLSVANDNARARIPWNWGRLRTLNGATVARSWADLWDGTIENPINITQTLVTKSTPVWTGSDVADSNSHCSNYISNNGASSSKVGSTDSTSNWLLSGNNDCNLSRSLYCISDPAGGADTDPVPLNMPMLVSYLSGATMTFDSATVLGITDPITITLTGTQGNPVLFVNDLPASGNTATVQMGDVVKVTMTAPTVLGEKYSAQLVVGTTQNYTLNIGYADSAKSTRVFVSSKVIYFNGVADLDNQCTILAEASGLGGQWVSMVTANPIALRDRIPWNWGQLKLVDNTTVVANNWDDLWDGTIDNPINLNEKGVLASGFSAATGATSNGGVAVNYSGNGFSGAVTYRQGDSGTSGVG